MIKIPGKIPIAIHPFFWVLAALIGWLNTGTLLGVILWTAVIVVSVLVHEFGHALTALAFGQSASISLMGMGGLTQREGRDLKLWQEFLIVLCGPLSGLALCALSYQLLQMIAPSNPLIDRALTISVYVNLIWTLLNLLPVQPLDGGHLLRILCEAAFGLRGVKVALFISMALAAGLSMFFFSMGAVIGGLFFSMFAFESYRMWRSALVLTVHDQNPDLQDMLTGVKDDLSRGDVGVALPKLQYIRAHAQRGVLYVAASECLAMIYHNQGDLQEAYKVLLPLYKELSSVSLRRLHQLAYQTGDWAQAVQFGQRAFQDHPNVDTALVNSLCHGLLGEVKPALGWLQRAINEGLSNPGDIVKKAEFDKIRADAAFQRFVSALAK